MSENQNLIAYYSNLLIIQYADKPKAKAVMNTLIGELMTYDIAVSVRDAFDPNTAVGVQLDIVAKYVGVSRIITGTTFTRVYFGYMAYGDISPFAFPGFIGYGDPVPDEQIRDYKESTQSLYALTDEELRVIIKLAIVKNYSNASVKDIDEILDTLFGAEVYFNDHLDMTIVSFLVGTNLSRIFNIAKSSGLLPKPAGVGTSIAVVPDINNIFGYMSYGGVVPSFAIGYTSYPEMIQEGIIFTGITDTPRGLATLNDKTFITLNQNIKTFFYDSVLGWQLIGTSSQIGDPNTVLAVCALSETVIAVSHSSPQAIRAYVKSGSDWVPLGNYGTTSFTGVSICKMTSTRVAVLQNTPGLIKVFDFDGTNWAQVGNTLSLSLATKLASLTVTDIAIIANDVLYRYTFDGTNLSVVGSGLSLSVNEIFEVSSFDSNSIIGMKSTGYVFQKYTFAGSVWTRGNSFTDTIQGTDITALDSDFFVAVGQSSAPHNKIVRYNANYQDLTGCLAAYAI